MGHVELLMNIHGTRRLVVQHRCLVVHLGLENSVIRKVHPPIFRELPTWMETDSQGPDARRRGAIPYFSEGDKPNLNDVHPQPPAVMFDFNSGPCLPSKPPRGL